MRLGKPEPQNVFLNVPFDPSYEEIFIALVVALVSLGRVPHASLEIAETGQGRMARIMYLISRCRVSVHDLSRVGLPVRFNMPFELGIAYMLRHTRGKHDIILVEKKRHRLDITLSDLKWIEPTIHQGRPLLALSGIYDVLGRPTGNPPIEKAEDIFKQLRSKIETIRHRSSDIFNRRSFFELAVGATELAQVAGLIRKRKT
jgi:hypothetical protein